MILLYNLFYRKFGIRKVEQLLMPPLPPTQLLDLPKKSLLHYLGHGASDSGPASDEFLFRNINKPIMADHVVQLADSKGAPRRANVAAEPLIRNYHTKNRRLRRIRNLETAVRDERTLVVYNYALLPQLYRYQRSYYAAYFQWWNQQVTLWDSVAKIAATTDRNQFIQISLPQVLPSLADFKLCGQLDAPTQRMVKVFNTPEALTLLELWKWFGAERGISAMKGLPQSAFSKVNLIFQEGGRWFVLNLGVLDNWRISSEEELAAPGNTKDPKKNKGFKPDQFQKRFLRLMMVLMETRTSTPPEWKDDEEAAAVKEAKGDQQPEVFVQQAGAPVIDEDGVARVKTEVKKVPVDAEVQEAAEHGEATKAEDIEIDHELEAQIDADLAALDAVVHPDEPTEVEHQLAVQELTAHPLEMNFDTGISTLLDQFAESGSMSAAEYRRFQDLSQSYKKIKAPDGSGTLDQFSKVTKEMLAIKESPTIKDIPTVLDKSMLKSSLLEFDERYVKEIMHKHVASMVLCAQNAGYAVTGYEKERIDDIQGSNDFYHAKLVPLEGAPSNFRFMLPVVSPEDGTYMTNGVNYRLRKQRGDLPIRKVAPDKVALTSYYGKIFVTRSEKRVNNYGLWLTNQVRALGLDEVDTLVVNMHTSNVFDSKFECPRLYSILAHEFRSFGSDGWSFNFDHTKRAELFGEDNLKTLEKEGRVVVAKNKQGALMVMDPDGALYEVKDGELVDHPSLEEMLRLESTKAPVDFAEVKVLGKQVPLGVVLGWELGLDRLMRLLKVRPRRVPAGQRVNLESYEYAVVFADETLVFNRDDRYASMILAGFNEYHRTIRQFSVYEFDKRGVYLNVLEGAGLTARYLREISLQFRMFVDPIAHELLVQMGEPTTYRGLLLRSAEMLLNDAHPDELDSRYMRIKGYERFAGAVYTELVKAIRVHEGRPGKARAALDIDPYAVKKAINQDPSVALVSEINPIQNLKEMEAVTYGGVGGRSSRSMTKRTRAYHPNDMGTISESTVDSSDVAINTYTSADPQFDSLLGTSKRYEIGKTGVTALLSTSALLSVGATNDDPKRVNFIAIQHGHGIACKGYHSMPVRTGYEQVIAHRTGDLFAYTARKDGRVVAVSEEGITIEYNDGETKSIELGRRYGHAAGLVVPHTVISDLKVGAKVKAGDIVSYNQEFFERDMLDRSQVVWKAGVLVKTAIFECTDTLEDSSVISTRIAESLTTKTTKVRTIVCNFDQSIRKLVKAGTQVEAEDILCTIEEAVTAQAGLFDEESLDTLKMLGAQTPQAKVAGLVERVEVFYHGDKEDMSESLQAIANAGDRDLIRRTKAAGKKGYNGSVDASFRVEGDPLPLDTIAIRIYITSDVPMGVGDKGVFANQMKTVIGRVMEGENTTESGVPIDGIFGYKSISDRIVLSPDIIGTTTTLLDVIGKKALEAYRGK